MELPRDIAGWQRGLVTRSAAETEAAGAALAGLIPPDTALLLRGDLGAGKTTLARGLARGLGVEGDVTSPSFALLNVHRGRRQLLHVDAYRLSDPSQFDGLLLDELSRSPWNLLVEWPERIRGHEPAGAWTLDLSPAGEGARLLRLTLPADAQ